MIPVQEVRAPAPDCEKCGNPNAHEHYADFAPDDPWYFCMECDPAWIP